MKKSLIFGVLSSLATPLATGMALSAAPAAEKPAALSTELPLESLMANEQAKAVVLKHMPGLDKHPSYDQMKAVSLRTIMPYSQGRIKAETLDAIDADLKTL